MTDWWQCQRNLPRTHNKFDCRWMVTAGCLPALFNEVRRFIFNSAKHFMPFRIWLLNALNQQQGCLSRWQALGLVGVSSSGSDSPRYSSMNDTCNTWKVLLSREMNTFPKMALLWLRCCWHTNKTQPVGVFDNCGPCSHVNIFILGTLVASEFIIIYECSIENLPWEY